MLNLRTLGIIISRDIICLNITYGRWKYKQNVDLPDIPVYELRISHSITTTTPINDIITVEDDEINVVLH